MCAGCGEIELVVQSVSICKLQTTEFGYSCVCFNVTVNIVHLWYCICTYYNIYEIAYDTCSKLGMYLIMLIIRRYVLSV